MHDQCNDQLDIRLRSMGYQIKSLREQLQHMENLMTLNFANMQATSDKLVATEVDVLAALAAIPGSNDAANQAEVDRLNAIFDKVNTDLQAGVHPVVTPPVPAPVTP